MKQLEQFFKKYGVKKSCDLISSQEPHEKRLVISYVVRSLRTNEKWASTNHHQVCRMLMTLYPSLNSIQKMQLCYAAVENNFGMSDLFMRLACEPITVSKELLRNLNYISDEQIKKIISYLGVSHASVIAQRKYLTVRTIALLLELNYKEAIISLLKNQHIRLSRGVVDELIVQSRYVVDYRSLLMFRPELTVMQADTMKTWVSEDSKYLLEKRFSYNQEDRKIFEQCHDDVNWRSIPITEMLGGEGFPLSGKESPKNKKPASKDDASVLKPTKKHMSVAKVFTKKTNISKVQHPT